MEETKILMKNTNIKKITIVIMLDIKVVIIKIIINLVKVRELLISILAQEEGIFIFFKKN
jgi:hypothetical protein